MAERRDVILGAGLSGLAAAYTFKQAGSDEWQVYERNDTVGGLARSIVKDGYTFDYGPHILFTIIDKMKDLITDLLGDNFHAQDRKAYIYHQQHDLYTEFPFQAHLYGLPANIVRDCLVGLVHALEAQARGEFHPTNYENWIRGFFGDGIADHLMVPYARKIWAVEPGTMSYTWAAGDRVPAPDAARIIEGALYSDAEKVGTHSKFWYTKQGGISELSVALSRRVDNIHLGKTIARIELPEKQVVFEDGEIVPFRRLVLTSPLCYLNDLVTNIPEKVATAINDLQFIGTCVVDLGIKRPNISDKHWVYFYEDIFPFHRISFPGSFSSSCVPEGCSSISTENSYSKDRPLNRDKMVEDTVRALEAANIIHPDDDVDIVHVEEILPSYVLFDLDHEKNVGIIRDWLRENDIWTCGRFGEWRYFNMDHSMMSGMATADDILAADGKV